MKGIFMPDKINVGYQERNGTYTGKLAYVIYFDEKGTLRKERSWNSWRNREIENNIYENVPTEGFVLNKKAGGYCSHWNTRTTYSRVYDPRGFEIEISIDNLLYILEHTSCIKGKGLEGEFVYGWDGTELVLIPVSSPEYIEIKDFSNILKENKTIKGKDLVLGGTYLDKKGYQYIYMGRFPKYGEYGNDIGKNKGNHYFFLYGVQESFYLKPIKSLGNKLVSCESDNCHENYAELYEKYVVTNREFSPIDDEAEKLLPSSYEDFEKHLLNYSWGREFYYTGHSTRIKIKKLRDIWEVYSLKISTNSGYYYSYDAYIIDKLLFSSDNLKKVYDTLKPKQKVLYLKNGIEYLRSFT